MTEDDKKESYGAGYGGKRPLWQWVLIYLVIGGVIYGLIYYFLLGGNRQINPSGSAPAPTSSSPFGY